MCSDPKRNMFTAIHVLLHLRCRMASVRSLGGRLLFGEFSTSPHPYHLRMVLFKWVQIQTMREQSFWSAVYICCEALGPWLPVEALLPKMIKFFVWRFSFFPWSNCPFATALPRAVRSYSPVLGEGYLPVSSPCLCNVILLYL